MTDETTLSEPIATNLELRESAADGSAGAGLAHSAEGLFLLHVLELAAFGEPRGAATIVHDAGDHGGRYVDLARALARDRWAIAMPDMRGSGQSEGPRGHSAGIQEVVRDLEEVQNHLAYRLTVAPRVLVGQGLGALYSLAYACERPGDVAALVLAAPVFEPSFPPPPKPTGLKRFLKKAPDPTTPGAIGWSAEQRLNDPAARQAWATDPHVHDVISVRAASQAVEAAERYASRLASLDVPTLVLCGEADAIAPLAGIQSKAGTQAKVVTYPGMGHDLFHESAAEEVVEQVRAWLDSVV